MAKDEQNADFGRILEDFERDEDRRSGRRQQRAPLIRQEEPAEPGRPREYQRPTEEEDFAAALAAFDAETSAPSRSQAQPQRAKPPQKGESVTGRLLSIDLETSFVDIGGKAEAVVSTADLADSDGVLLYKVGDEIQAQVVGRDEGTGSLRLRPAGGQGDPRGPLHVGDVVEGTVTAVNKGGVDVDLKGRRAFCPISQLSDRFVEDAGEMVGQKLKFEVTRYEEGRGRSAANIVISRKALLVREKEAKAEATRARLEVGAVLTGTVSSLADYGAFVDLGGLDGMVHVSEISHQRVSHPKDILTPGQQVQVKVEKIERRRDGKDRIALSMKSLERDPWLDSMTKWAEGTVAEGQIRRLESFGAFVELEPGVEGLIHISELGSGRRINHPREVVQPGQTLAVKVLSLDVQKQRIGLAPVHDGEAQENDPGVRELLENSQKSGGEFGAMAHFFKKTRK